MLVVGLLVAMGCARTSTTPVATDHPPAGTSTPEAGTPLPDSQLRPTQTLDRSTPTVAAPDPTVSATPSASPTPSRSGQSTPRPASTGEPKPAATPTHEPSPTAEPDGVALPDAPDRDLYELARSLLLKTADPVPKIVNPSPISYEEGRTDTFNVTNLSSLNVYSSRATLRLVSPRAYWYVEEGIDVSGSDLEKAARAYEEEIYPRVTAAFGREWTPGVDNDPHLTILHARIRGASGYFSSVDEYPANVRKNSNQREMIYMDAGSLKVGSRTYLGVLAHELQHAIQWNGDRTEESWINEGLAEVAKSIAGYDPTTPRAFLRSPTISVVNWPDHVTSYYGASFLFLDYLATHYGSHGDLIDLVKEPLDGIAGIDAYLARLGFQETFRDVFRDWVVTNYLDEPGGGRYGYPDRDVELRVEAHISDHRVWESSIPQYSAEYVSIDINKGDIEVRFEGSPGTPLLPAEVDPGGCWWGNRGDSISSTLTRPLDLTGVDRATLSYRVWFDTEEQWDYVYVEVSTDGGATWDVVEAPGTSSEDRLGNSYGPGYTGDSGGWIREEVDLTAYAGRRILLRFHNVTDEGINEIGVCLDDFAVPEIGFSDGGGMDSEWVAEGFLLIDNQVPQDYIVQIIEVGDETRVVEMDLDEKGRGVSVIRDLGRLDDLIVVVAALAPKTLQEAPYTLTIGPVP